MSCPKVLKVLSAADNSMLSSPLVCGCIIRELRGKRSTLGGRFVGALVLGVLLTVDRREVQAQVPVRDLMIAMRSDCAAWQHVLAYVIGRLSTDILRAAADTNAQPMGA